MFSGTEVGFKIRLSSVCSHCASLDALFCDVDDFCLHFEPQWQKRLLNHGGTKRPRAKNLCLSKIMTILIAFDQNHDRNFQHFYIDYVMQDWKSAFAKLPSYQRFVEWMPSTLIPLCVYLQRCFGSCTGISLVDATSLKVGQMRSGTRPQALILKHLRSLSFRAVNFCVNVLCGLIAYCHQPKKRFSALGGSDAAEAFLDLKRYPKVSLNGYTCGYILDRLNQEAKSSS